jgi:hypothetical protein
VLLLFFKIEKIFVRDELIILEKEGEKKKKKKERDTMKVMHLSIVKILKNQLKVCLYKYLKSVFIEECARNLSPSKEPPLHSQECFDSRLLLLKANKGANTLFITDGRILYIYMYTCVRVR